ncbi:ABC transporter permease [uncultured Jatrophihabitans sp.]|uniref:ABC transporter permease n=1 Tax=uncultured Jatrophihabitans sp. TaxID=1610747 RepID=UPI0035CB78F8
MFRRRRNIVLLAILAVVPILISVAVRASQHGGQGGNGILSGVSGNGLFAALAALLVSGPVFLPLVTAVVAGDSVAGEASSGTLRYLLAVPVARTRLLAVKFSAILAWLAACVLVVAVFGVLSGLVLFPNGQLTLLSGTTVSYGEGMLRLLGVCGYVVVSLLTVGAIGLFVSTMTEVPVAAMAATLTLTVISEVADAVPQLSGVHRWLPSHYWLRWVDLLRAPVSLDGIVGGLLASVAYIAFFVALAWARFGGKDVTA